MRCARPRLTSTGPQAYFALLISASTFEDPVSLPVGVFVGLMVVIALQVRLPVLCVLVCARVCVRAHVSFCVST